MAPHLTGSRSLLSLGGGHSVGGGKRMKTEEEHERSRGQGDSEGQHYPTGQHVPAPSTSSKPAASVSNSSADGSNPAAAAPPAAAEKGAKPSSRSAHWTVAEETILALSFCDYVVSSDGGELNAKNKGAELNGLMPPGRLDTILGSRIPSKSEVQLRNMWQVSSSRMCTAVCDEYLGTELLYT